jgi:23S rRNA-intervening sequence protein
VISGQPRPASLLCLCSRISNTSPWQKAMDFVAAVYKITRMFPKEEMYGLTSQLRRAAVSIPSNIAEGQGRQTTAEFRQFLGTLADLYWKRNTNSARVAL